MTQNITTNLANLPRSVANEILHNSGFRAKSQDYREYESAKSIFAAPFAGTSSYDKIVKIICDYLRV